MSSKVLCPEIKTSVNLVILRDVFAVSFYALYSTVRTFEKKFFRLLKVSFCEKLYNEQKNGFTNRKVKNVKVKVKCDESVNCTLCSRR